ncbi:MAG: GH1 family beta-glucosidase [Chromatiaceae bacterium]|jgi:beta-glucosidase
MATGILFPEGFLWGAATSAYQIEGSPLADGAGPSIWHRFSRSPGKVANGDTGDVACDHYRRWADDVALMAALGLGAYRLSVAWGRVMPEGRGPVNPKGLAFYERLVDRLLSCGIVPMVTLYHWDLPAALDDRGGWLNRDSAGWFADYAVAVFRTLADRVRLWVTINEPWVVAVGGYLQGDYAPGHRSIAETPLVANNLLRAHASAVEGYRAWGRHQIGIAVNLEPQHALSDSPADTAAAQRRDAFVNRWFLDPLLLGRYPPELTAAFGDAWPRFPEEDLKRIHGKPDFLGVNYYSRALVREDLAAVPLRASSARLGQRAQTAMGWEVYPRGLREILLWIKGRYGNPPVYVTENGAAFDDPIPVRGEVQDPLRVDYLRRHLMAAASARREGVDLRGYFAWSLLDNFEWAHGYAKRFGLVHVDFPTQRRRPKASARYYADVIRSRGSTLAAEADQETDLA